MTRTAPAARDARSASGAHPSAAITVESAPSSSAHAGPAGSVAVPRGTPRRRAQAIPAILHIKATWARRNGRAASTILERLAHPEGGPLIENLLGQARAPADARARIEPLPLQQPVALSQGKLSQSVVGDQASARRSPPASPANAGA